VASLLRLRRRGSGATEMGDEGRTRMAGREGGDILRLAGPKDSCFNSFQEEVGGILKI